MIATDQRRHTIVSNAATKFPFGDSAASPITWNKQLQSWIILIFCVVGCILDETPQNIAAVKGTQVRLQCSTLNQAEAAWTYRNSAKPNDVVSLNKGTEVVPALKNLFSVDVSSTSHFNLLFNASEHTSGIYTCRKNKADIVGHSAYVIALDENPTCSYELKGVNISAKCRIGFSGLWTPLLEWSNGVGRLEPYSKQIINNSEITVSMTVPFNRTDEYRCKPWFLPDNIPTDVVGRDGMAQNFAEFGHSCNVPGPPTTTGADQTTETQHNFWKAEEDLNDTVTLSSSVNLHHCYCHSLHLCLSLATVIFVWMTHKW